MQDIEKAVAKVMLGHDAHGIDHILRVRDLAIQIGKREKADLEIVELAALLHDVDDYKIVGEENAKKLSNTKNIMNDANIEARKQQQVIDIVDNMGYSKCLAGIRPTSLEGKVVSDADMLDGSGAISIIRMSEFDAPRGKPYFDPTKFPKINPSPEEYKSFIENSSVDHFFVKLLRIKNLMMTKTGQEEAKPRHEILIAFLRHLFQEYNSPEWLEYLDKYLEEEDR